MSKRESYSEQEWKSLLDAPTYAAMGITKLDFGIVSAAKEFVAAVRGLGDGARRYPANELIQALSHDHAATPNHADDAHGPSTIEAILQLVRQARDVIDAKSPAEAPDYKHWIQSTVEATANASGEGVFGTGKRVSDKEAQYLGQVRAALGL